MEREKSNLIPNSTQIPNVILDFLIPFLPEAEGKCLLYICRRTFGFHKTEDSISFSQFTDGIKTKEGKILDHGTGLSRPTINEALSNLFKANAILTQKKTTGTIYKINLELDPEKVVSEVNQLRKITSKNKTARKVVSEVNQLAKLTGSSKRVLPEVVSEVNLQKKEKQRETKYMQSASPLPGDKPKKPKSQHQKFIDFFYETTQVARGMKLVITGADGKNLKRILDLHVLDPADLEKLALYFLADPGYKEFAPGISTFLSAGILNGLANKMQNNPDFWKKINLYQIKYRNREFKVDTDAAKKNSEMLKKLEELKKKLFNMPNN